MQPVTVAWTNGVPAAARILRGAAVRGLRLALDLPNRLIALLLPVTISPGRVFLLATFCLAWTFLVPGFVAFQHELLSGEQVRQKVAVTRAGASPSDTPVSRFLQFDNTAREAEARLAQLLRQGSHAGADEYVKLAESWTQRPRTPPVGVRRVAFFGFAESKTPYVYFAATFALFVLVWLESLRRPSVRVWSFTTLLAGVGVWLGWGGLSLFRAKVLGDDARTIFSFVHIDIDRIGFWLAEARAVVLCLLVAQLWRGRLGRRSSPGQSLETSAPAGSAAIPVPLSLHRRALCVGQRFDRWQLDSLLLTTAFFPWTLYYWSLGRTWEDPRYYASTMIWHIVWGICWWCLSAPTFAAWRQFTRQRAHLEAVLVAKGRSRGQELPHGGGSKAAPAEPGGESLVQWVHELRPVSTMRVAVTGGASIVTFLLPVFEAVK